MCQILTLFDADRRSASPVPEMIAAACGERETRMARREKHGQAVSAKRRGMKSR
jgi:hypothetical protein